MDLAAAPGGGVDVEGVQSTGKSVDLANEMVNLKQSVLYYDANGMVIRVSDRMYGSLLNILDTRRPQRRLGSFLRIHYAGSIHENMQVFRSRPPTARHSLRKIPSS